MYANNSVIDINLVGEGYPGFTQTDGGALECHTDDTTCCRRKDSQDNTTASGEWYYPNGDLVLPRNDNDSNHTGFYRTRQHMVIRLNRGGVVGPTGMFKCVIPSAGGGNITQYITLRGTGTVLCKDVQRVNNRVITYSPPRGVSADLKHSDGRYIGTIATYSNLAEESLICSPDGKWKALGNFNESKLVSFLIVS